jgi:hypothetical protein
MATEAFPVVDIQRERRVDLGGDSLAFELLALIDPKGIGGGGVVDKVAGIASTPHIPFFDGPEICF